ncbi:hypothetical protein [Mycobacterium angelicum]|uniref:hypothetical protein n=1 Tax=Mycobacterium angelicum TaxID=470074 RepID=UPI00111C54DF|nr:hypothetical protein [Mycobacterium angelicum]MCV7198160.1 hypothetical protein [Mycobacterium angelicum]
MDCIDPEQLYDERGSVARSRPIFQGDVFKDVVLPCIGDTPRLVQIVAHPCSMRAGTSLRPRITVAPVEEHSRVNGNGWNQNLRIMPLAEIINGRHYAAKFVDVTAAPSELLRPEARIATLSDKGIYVLQQRIVKHYTRFEVDLPSLAKETAPVLWEMHQQRDWVETVFDDEGDWTNENLAAEESAFDAWLREGNPSRRTQLKDDHTHTDLRRAAHKAALARRAEVGDRA